MQRIFAVLVVIIAAAGIAYFAFFRAETDWRQTTIDDVNFIHTALMEGHPGAVDPDNPEFLATLEAAHALALERAETVTDAAGHFYVKRGFTTAFEDVHLADQLYSRPALFPAGT